MRTLFTYAGYLVKKAPNQNVPSDLSKRPIFGQNVPSIFAAYLIKIEIGNIFCEHTGQNVPKSKCPRVKTSQSQNVPESNHAKSKRPRVKASHFGSIALLVFL